MRVCLHQPHSSRNIQFGEGVGRSGWTYLFNGEVESGGALLRVGKVDGAELRVRIRLLRHHHQPALLELRLVQVVLSNFVWYW